MTKEVSALMPEYAKDFACIGEACEDNCCHENWIIAIDKKTYNKYMSIADPNMQEKFKKYIKRNPGGHSANFAMLQKEPDVEGCPFETEEGWCSIQLNMGAEALSKTCASYPRKYLKLGDNYEFDVQISCPEVARKALFNEQPMQFVEHSIDLPTYTAHIRFGGNGASHNYFHEVRNFIIQIMQNRAYRFYERAILLGMFIKKFNETPDMQYQSVLNTYAALFAQTDAMKEQIASLPEMPDLQYHLINALTMMLSRRNLSKNFLALLTETFQGLNLSDADDAMQRGQNFTKLSRELLEDNNQLDIVFENYFSSYWFFQQFAISRLSYNPSGQPETVPDALWNSYTIMCLEYLYYRVLLTGLSTAKKELTKEDIVRVFYLTGRKLFTHDNQFTQETVAWLKHNQYDTLGHMAAISLP